MPIVGLGAQLCPCGLVTATPQTFTVTSRPASINRPRSSPPVPERVRTAIQPTSTGLELAPYLRGFTRWFLAYTFPSHLPDPHHPVVLARPVVVGAAPTLPSVSPVRLLPASAQLLRQPDGGGLSPPLGNTAPRGAHTRDGTGVVLPVQTW